MAAADRCADCSVRGACQIMNASLTDIVQSPLQYDLAKAGSEILNGKHGWRFSFERLRKMRLPGA